jgi:hypothetical protein
MSYPSELKFYVGQLLINDQSCEKISIVNTETQSEVWSSVDSSFGLLKFGFSANPSTFEPEFKVLSWQTYNFSPADLKLFWRMLDNRANIAVNQYYFIYIMRIRPPQAFIDHLTKRLGPNLLLRIKELGPDAPVYWGYLGGKKPAVEIEDRQDREDRDCRDRQDRQDRPDRLLTHKNINGLNLMRFRSDRSNRDEPTYETIEQSLSNNCAEVVIRVS